MTRELIGQTMDRSEYISDYNACNANGQITGNSITGNSLSQLISLSAATLRSEAPHEPLTDN
jgi:hypothetical protein